MTLFSRSSRAQPIGLDLGCDSVKLLQLEVVGEPARRSLSVVAAARQSLEGTDTSTPQKRMDRAVETIGKLLARQPFVGREVVAAVPREMVHVKNLRLPPMPADELAQAVAFEARTVFPFDLDEARVEYLPAGEVRQGNETRQEVIVLAVKRAEVDAYLEQLASAGVVVRSLDAEVTGLFRSVERFVRRREDEQDVQMLIDVGARRTQVMIGRGRDVNFYKPVEIGGHHLTSAVARKLGVTDAEARGLRHRLLESDVTAAATTSPAEAAAAVRRDPVRQAVADATRGVSEELGRELAMCLRYYTVTFRGHRPTRVRLVGGEADDPQVLAAVRGALGLPVETGRPLFSVDTARMPVGERAGSMARWALAMGLGLRFVDGYFPARDGRPRTITAAAALGVPEEVVATAPASLAMDRETPGAGAVPTVVLPATPAWEVARA